MSVVHGKLARLYWWNKNISNMSEEPCTESGSTAQVTDSTKRRLNPNNPPTFSDSGGSTLIDIDYVNGIGYFQSNVGSTVTCHGEYVAQADLTAVGYITNWSLTISGDVADSSAFGDNWRTGTMGLASWTATADGFYEDDTFSEMITYETSPVEKRLFLIEFYTDDPANNKRYVGWGFVSGINPTAGIGDLVKQTITITGFRNISYITS